MKDKKKEVVDLRTLCRSIWQHRLRFCIVLPIVCALSAWIILSVPRYYECKVELSPELSTTEAGGLQSIISSVGLGGLAGAGTDAIYPYLYPDLVSSNEFCMSMFGVAVETIDGAVSTNYKTYLQKHQNSPWWSSWVRTVKRWVSPSSDAKISVAPKEKSDDHIVRLNKADADLVKAIGRNITCTVDKKTEVIFITVKDQDPLVCATVADTVMTRLQHFITSYRTKKARVDLEYSEKIYSTAKAEYESSRAKYAGYMDSHRDVVSPAVVAQGQKLENDMSLKFSTLSEVTQQLQMAKAKVQENTPAFTIVQGPAVPVRPAGPKRMLFVFGMLILGFFVTTLTLFKDRFWDIID